ncbi:MAG: cyclase family protein [Flavobacteriaceae bacterium]|nr:cyclase family protein [Flavobacteriaceae bacterium]
MIATINYNSRKLQIDLEQPLDISLPLRMSKSNVIAWYQKEPTFKKIRSVAKNHVTNFNGIYFAPHAHGTHTECVGHITKEFQSVNQHLKQFFFLAEVITVVPERMDKDFVISKKQVQHALGNKKRDAVVIRTLPNTDEKLSKKYSHTNPPYLLEEVAVYLREKGVEHLLVDLPSIDKESNDSQLIGHHAFWNTKGKIRYNATITELIFVPNQVEDGEYFLSLQIAPFENDASPCKPVLYKVIS